MRGPVAGPEHDMQWLTGVAVRPGLIEEYTRTAGAVLAGPPRAAQALDREGIAC